jgi:formamidopyrimidine-DNA glycosylase
MPELPEVEFSTRRLSRLLLNSTITHINPLEQGGGPRTGQFDDIVLSNLASSSTLAAVEKLLLNRKITGTGRIGKYSWLFLDNTKQALTFHLGMSGWIDIKGISSSFHLDSSPATSSSSSSSSDQKIWPPKFTKLLVKFSNSIEIAFSDPRRLGRVSLIDDPYNKFSSDLAPDPLLEMPNHDEFVQRLMKLPTSGGGPIKSVLLDQRALVCGVGNYLADEILLMAKIHPETPARAIVTTTDNNNHHEVAEQLRTSIVTVIKTCCDCLDQGKEFPSSYLFHSRWGKSTSATTTATSNKSSSSNTSPQHISQIQVGGRTTLFIAGIQKKYSLNNVVKKTLVTVSKKRTMASAGSSVIAGIVAATTTTTTTTSINSSPPIQPPTKRQRKG